MVASTAELMEQVRAAGLQRPDGARTARHFAAHIALYVATVAVAEWVGNPVVWIVAWVVLAYVLFGAAAATHEAIHNNLFVGRRANRLAGTIAGASVGMSFAGYRAYHLAHHADTRGPTDPEPTDEITGPGWWLLAMLLAGPVLLVQFWGGVITTLFGRPPAWAKNRVHTAALRRGAIVGAAEGLLIGVCAWLAPGPLLRWWVAPLVLLWFGGIGAAVVIPEHNGLTNDGGDAFQWTRTTLSNPLLRWFFWNNNFHTAHHLVPTVPWCRLPELHAVIADRYEHVERGYVGYHVRLIRRTAHAPSSTT